MNGLALPESPRILVYSTDDPPGPAVRKLPFLRALRGLFPDADITWVAGRGASAYRSLLAPLVAGLLTEVIDEAGIGESWADIFSRPMQDRNFDLIIDTQDKFLTALAVKNIRARHFVSAAGGFMLSAVKPDLAASPMPSHPAARLLWLLHHITGEIVDPFAPLPMAGEVLRLAEMLLPGNGPYLAINPTPFNRGGTSWPLENYARAARSLVGNGWRPAFFLAPEDAGKREEIAAAVPGAHFPLQQPPARRYNGRHDLTVALAGRCQAALVGTGDMTHLLAMAGMPMVMLAPDDYAADNYPMATRLDLLSPAMVNAAGAGLERITPARALQAVSDLTAPPPPPEPPPAPRPDGSARRGR